MDPPLWLLDVDGVLNAVTRSPDPSVWPDWRSGTATADGTVWPIWFSPTVTATVRRLHESGLAEVRWLTTWGRQANEELRALLDLPELVVVADPHDTAADPSPAAEAAEDARGATSHGAHVGAARPGWWKLDAVRRLLGSSPPRPLVWTDDDLRFQRDATAWAAAHVPRRLLIAPPVHLGLTPAMLREVRAFCGDREPDAAR